MRFTRLKKTGSGGDKAIEKTDTFNPPENKDGNY